ncbi:class I mannose-6-phosphate isomerase [Candidatus Stoquefichus massiliensis]|uniref:class I mannose-6-phosphate isomerase n=1 Tax=Candidatus Stoquefichus massiliensis TaxID=1470350 RepID=UPI00047F6319|nr:class I mannose-6-phosphate isomerase [Candidatus Stoquefichus massiliensis]
MNYNKYPEIKINGFDHEVYKDKNEIKKKLDYLSLEKEFCLTVECYLGIDDEILEMICDIYKPEIVLRSEDIFFDKDTLNQMMKSHLTDDRVRGVMYYGKMEDFIDYHKLQVMKEKIQSQQRILIYGVGASFISRGDLYIYCDLSRWEIQCRYRQGMPNFKQDNDKEDILIKNKRGFFIEWRIADKQKIKMFNDIDFLIDSHMKNQPKMITGNALREGLKQIVKQPFRLVPYFDPGVWGGQWMKEVCGLNQNEKNYAWSFDGVPEENSLYLKYNETRIEIPAMDLVLYRPKELLGMKNYCRFGAEFPIRFDFLDTIQGQNLSLQVHPLTEYIKSHFGMTYTQDESYYILDCEEGGGVYLGLKENVCPEDMIHDLEDAQVGKSSFDADRYINFFPAKKHDHFLIPAGTVHCSSSQCMVLEISATPYIFTFKLWDWNRLGLDGLPRPIHIEDGIQNIQWDRQTQWVKDNLVNQIEVIHDQQDYLEEKTGLHEFEFIETRRFTSNKKTYHSCEDSVHMLNLVEGSEAVIESPQQLFDPFIVHYAETFIIPAAVKEYTIRPVQEEELIKFVKAYVRN